MGIMSTGLWSVGFSIATARSRKLLKRLVATPMVRGYYLGSFVLKWFVFLGLETVVLMGFAWLVFGVEIQGTFAAFAGVCAVGALPSAPWRCWERAARKPSKQCRDC